MMKKYWGYLSAFLGGLATALVFVWLTVRNKISTSTIEITRPKIKNSADSKQDFTSQIIGAAKKADKQLKKEQRKANRLAKKQRGN